MKLKRIMTIEIPMRPKGKGRPRTRRGSGNPYTPEDTRNKEAYMMMMSAEAMKDKPITEGPIILDLKILMPAPVQVKKKILKDPSNAMLWYPMRKPDVDNVLKSVMDAMNGIVWLDDKQVVDVTQTKRYTIERPMIQVTVDEITGGDEDG